MTDVQLSPWLRLILFMIANLLIVLMAPVSYSLFTGELLALVATAVFFLTFILMYVVTWVFVRLDGGRSVEELGVTVDQRFGSHITIGAIAGTISAVLVVAIAYFFGGQLRPLDQITGDLIVNEIIITAPTAFFEELVHRGYILSRMEGLAGKRVAIFFSSLFFSLLHFTWWAEPGFPMHLAILFTFNMFLGGVVLSFSYYWSGRRLWVPIAFHFMWNMIAYLVFPTFPREAVIQPEIFQIEWGITTIAGFLLGLSILWSLLATVKNKE
ncbi:MAG: lysostaphin resistance A-like protein [Promethearchaeota archaeon]